MQFLSQKKPPFPPIYTFLVAFIITTIIISQLITANIVEGDSIVNYQKVIKHSSQYLINYFVWALLINRVCGFYNLIVESFPFSIKKFIWVFINLSGLILLQLFIVIIPYYFISILFFDLDVTSIFFKLVYINPLILLIRLLDLILILLIFKIIYTYKTLQDRKLQIIDLKEQISSVQLQALRAQLNPHFLFNALHALHTLIGYNDDKAKTMVIKISTLLRKMLEHKDQHIITLEEELVYVKDYLEIEQERFYDRLSVQVKIDENTKQRYVPALILQPLIENAIKHGISLLEKKGVICLSTSLINDELVLKIENTAPIELNSKKFKTPSTKVGLVNVEKRLKTIYGNDYVFDIKREKDLFKAHLIIKKNILK